MKLTKRFISALLTLAMLFSIVTIPQAIFAEEDSYVAVIDETGVQYTSLEEALTAALTGQTVRLLSDLTFVTKTGVGNREVTIEGDDHTINFRGVGTTSTDARGIQTNSNGKLTIKNVTMDGTGHAGVGLYMYAGELVLDGVTLTNFDNTITGLNGGAINVDNSKYSKKLTLRNCAFSNNQSSKGSDVYIGTTFDTGVTKEVIFDGINKIQNIYKANKATLSAASTFDNQSKINITFESTSLADGTKIIDLSAAPKNAYKCFTIPKEYTSKGKYITENGALGAKILAKVGTTTFTSFKDAVVEATGKSTTSERVVVLMDDIELSERFVYSLDYIGVSAKSGLTITDDGSPKTIYLYSSGSGPDARGFQTNFSTNTSKVNFQGTKLGNLTIVGHDPAGTTYNAGPLFYAYGGLITFTNVIIKEAHYGALHTAVNVGTVKDDGTRTIYSGGFVLRNTRITDCVGENGAAIHCEGGSVDIASSTIKNNYSTGNVAGGVYVADYTLVEDTGNTEFPATVTLDLDCTITDNKKGCSLQDEEIIPDGPVSDLYLATESLVLVPYNASTNLGRIGIDGRVNGDFAQSSSTSAPTSTTQTNLPKVCFSNVDSSVTFKWSSPKFIMYSFNYDYTLGDKIMNDDGSFYYDGLSNISHSDNVCYVGLKVDEGYFNFDWSKISTSFDKIYFVDKDGNFELLTTKPTEIGSYKALTLQRQSGISNTPLSTIVQASSFYVPDYKTQVLTIGMLGKANMTTSDMYLAGNIYSYVSTPSKWKVAYNAATGGNKDLVGIQSRLENEFLIGAFGGQNGWLAGSQSANAWYWIYNESSKQITANAEAKKGYNGAFTNFSDGELIKNGYLYMAGDSGKWCCEDSNAEMGYYTIKEDKSARVFTAESTKVDTETRMVSLAPNYKNGIGMKYYFNFSDSIAFNNTSYVEVKVGANEAKRTLVKDIISNNDTNSRGNYGLLVPLAAKELGDDIVVRVCTGSGQTVALYGTVNPCNYLYYAAHIIENKEQGDALNDNFSDDQINMIKALLNYGAEAQLKFEYNIDKLANADYPDVSGITPVSSIKNAYLSKSGTSVSVNASLAANSTTDLILTFSGITATTVTVDNASTKVSDNGITINADPSDLGHIYHININGEADINVNVYYIIKLILDNETDDATIKLADRLYKFGRFAGNYYGAYEVNADAIDAIINTAYSYLNKEEYTQYDMNLAYSKGNVSVSGNLVVQSRRQLDAVPEDMTQYKSAYLDCSSFVYNVYKSVYGASAARSSMISSSSNDDIRTLYMTYYPNETSVVKTYTSLAPSRWYNSSDSQKEGYINNWKNVISDAESIMQPGDLLAYWGYNDEGIGGGHVVMWTGDGFIHCTGGSYDMTTGSDKIEIDGAVHFIPTSSYTYTYLMKHGAMRATILRPLNVLASKGLTDYGKARNQLGSIGVTVTGYDETTGTELYEGQSITNGDTVTYTVSVNNRKMRNNNTADKEVDVELILPSQFVITGVSEGGSYRLDKASFKNVYVGVNDTVNLTVTGLVSGSKGNIFDGPSGNVKLSAAGDYAIPIAFKATSLEFEDAISAADIEAITSITSTSAKKNFDSSKNGVVNVNEILSAALGREVSFGTSDESVRKTYFTAGQNNNFYVDYTKVGAWSNKLVYNFAAGQLVYSRTMSGNPFSYAERVRVLSEKNLKIGDVLMTYRSSSGQYDYYIYIGGTSMIAVSSDGVSKVTTTTYLQRCLGRTSFVVLRTLGR